MPAAAKRVYRGGPVRTATVTKILAGTDQANNRRDDAKTKPKGTLALPGGVRLTERERFWWDFYVENGENEIIHGRIDSGMVVRLARATVKVEELEEATSGANGNGGGVIRLASGRTMMNPLLVALWTATNNYRSLLRDCGFSPHARLRFSPLLDAGKGGAWGED